MLGLSACGNASSETSSNVVFDFRGSAFFEKSNATYNISIKGYKDEDDSILLTVDELPEIELGGYYTYVENAGYKIYFDDVSESFVYTSYDPSAKEFSFKYTLNLGEGLGQSKVRFTYVDESFVYDGVGLGKVPPIFTDAGDNYALIRANVQIKSLLTCFEDGSCVVTSECATAVDPRKGTYTYDRNKDVYHFVFDAQSCTDKMGSGYLHDHGYQDQTYDESPELACEFDSVYDSSKNAYTLEIEILYFFKTDIRLIYNVED